MTNRTGFPSRRMTRVIAVFAGMVAVCCFLLGVDIVRNEWTYGRLGWWSSAPYILFEFILFTALVVVAISFWRMEE